MRNLLALLAAGIIGFAGVGWYLGWYQVQTTPAPSGKNAVKIEIDRTKIGDDLHKGEEKLHKVLDKASQSSDQGKSASITKSDATKTDANDP
jgi:hypothetical protein